MILAATFSHRDADVVVKGMDELQVEDVFTAVCAAVFDDEAVLADCAPKVILLETIRDAADGDGAFIRQTGGVGNYGHVVLRLEPMDWTASFALVNELPGEVLRSQFVGPIQQGILEALRGGILHGYEMVGVKATLVGGSHHATDSNEMAFQIAASQAFKDAARKASPVLLEPMMEVEAMVSVDNVVATINDITSRLGQVEGLEDYSGRIKVTATAPLRELLRSSRHGRPDFPMTFVGYRSFSPSDGGLGEDGATAPVRNPIVPKFGGSAEAAPLRFEHNSTKGLN